MKVHALIKAKMEIAVVSVLFLCLLRDSLAQGANKALGKPTDQTDTLAHYTADKAVNGKTNNCLVDFTHTVAHANNWWTVDLQRFVRNPSVKVFPRFLYNDTYRVLLGNFTWRSSIYKTCSERRIDQASEDFVCQGMIGRFVGVQRVTTTQPLCLCEVEVRGDEVERNRALGQSTSQSTTAADYFSSIAVNGRRSGPFTHTKNDDPKWWQVDLIGKILIYKFIITPRSGGNYGGNYSASVRNSSLYGAPSLICQDKTIPNKTTEFNCSGLLLGRYAVVEYFNEITPLCLHEVEVYGFCPPGYHGSRCNISCPVNCIVPCDETTGFCSQCVKGNWGNICNQTCPKYCSSASCDQDTGGCDSCMNGFWGANCERKCGNCSVGSCEKSGNCPGGCIKGYYGTKCDQECPLNCYQSTCHRDDGTCLGCKRGFWGMDCWSRCGNCLDVTCHQTDASCPVCKSGFRGLECNDSCPENCASACNKYSGRCDECLPGTWGSEFCEKSCSQSCDITNDSRLCNRTNGWCNKCPFLFWGEECDRSCMHCKKFPCDRHNGHCESCRQGFYGKLCDKQCPTNCSACDQNTGVCKSCTEGTYGERCDKTCPLNCGKNKHCDRFTSKCLDCPASFHGDHCSQHCPDSCANNRTCFQGNGSCVSCPASRYGADCREECGKGCRGGICNHGDGLCVCWQDYDPPYCRSKKYVGSPLNVAAIGGGLGVVILILILLLVGLVILVRNGKRLPGIKSSETFQKKDSYYDTIQAPDIPTVYEELNHREQSDNASCLGDGSNSSSYANVKAEYCELSPSIPKPHEHKTVALNVYQGGQYYQNQTELDQLKGKLNEQTESKRNTEF